jgi:glyoxylase-like metal-dependent hydrolase (beta-lactamase superfamily II)
MGMRGAMAVVAMAGALALPGPGWAQAPAAPTHLVRPELLKPVSAHVQVIPDMSQPVVPNVGFVVGTRGVLVIDTGAGPKNGALVGEVAKRLAAGKPIWLVATHAHPEHDLGASAFPPGTKLIRSTQQAGEAEADMRLSGVFQQRSQTLSDLLKGAEFRKADVTFEGVHKLDLGGVTAEIRAMPPAHTAGDTIVWIAADKVLFSGDLAMSAQPSIMAARATLATWRQALDTQAAYGAKVVVPSHGPIGDAGLIQGYRDYLAEVERRTKAAKAAGGDVDKAIAEVTAAMADRYKDRARLAGAVRTAFADS